MSLNHLSDTQPSARLMAVAIDEAERAAGRGEVPIGAVLADPAGVILARAGNAVEGCCPDYPEHGAPDPAGPDPAGHAEILVLRAAARQAGRPRLPGTVLYVTLEPCAMCAAAISFARVARVVFAAVDPKGGAVVNGPRFFGQPTCHHRPVVEQFDDGGQSAALLRSFFRSRRGARRRSTAGGDGRKAETWRDRTTTSPD